MINLDDAETKANEIYVDVKGNINNIETEEDAKIQIINRILNECLGWSFTDFKAETHHENGYSDYILFNNEVPVLLIEAKRIGIIDIRTIEKKQVRHLKISGSSLKRAMPGIDQAASYSLANGIPITVLTDGISWIVFKTFTPGENFKTKEAIVFPSLEAVISSFSYFFDLLSKGQFNKRLYNSIFDDLHNKRLLLTQGLISPLAESDVKISQKSDIAFDLDRVFSNFFSRLTGDVDEDLLIECFVETRESRIADFSLEKMTMSVLGNIVPKDKSVDTELASLIKTNVETDPSESGQTVFIVGPTGAGKTTFLDRFFRKTLPNSIRRKCVLIRVNCLDATGREDTALTWITERLISELEKEVYKEGAPTWDELLGLYMGEYKRRLGGVDAQLYTRDKQAFKEKFGEFLDQKVESDREGYLKRILEDVVNNRGMLPIILIDNTDEFTNEYKQKFFQFTQSLRRHINHCLVIFPVTDKSAWSFSKTDIFGIYESRSFFLPTPSPREVFRKRIDFLKNAIAEHGENKNNKNKKTYLSGTGIKISIQNLDGFAQVLENIFVDHDYTSKTLGELTNYNIRRTLLLSQRIMTSSVIKIEDLIKSYLIGKFVATDFATFMEALMKGDYEVYKQGDNHEIYPIFQVDSEVRQSPLLNLRILTLLDSANKGSRTVEDKHLGIQSVIDYFNSIGCSESAMDKVLMSLLDAGLIEPYDASNRNLSQDQKLAISYRGVVHLRLATHNSVFFYQMALTTAVTNEEVALKIKSIYSSKLFFNKKQEAVKKEFLKYLINEDKQFISVNSELDQYDCQKKLIDNLEKYILQVHADDDLVATHGEEFKQGLIKKEVLATIDYYDSSKGYGFAEVENIESRIFVHAKKLKDHEIDSLKDGDRILCDVARGEKGLYIEKIYDFDIDASESEIVNCQIIRLFPERGYGFVRLEGDVRTAFFHVTVFPYPERKNIEEGQLLKAEICPDRKGDGFQIKRIVSADD